MGNKNSAVKEVFTNMDHNRSVESCLIHFHNNGYLIYRDNKSFYIIYDTKIYNIFDKM